jgi:hypothetical protein
MFRRPCIWDSVPETTNTKFLGNRIVDAHIHGNAQVKGNNLWECVFPLRSFCDPLSPGWRDSSNHKERKFRYRKSQLLGAGSSSTRRAGPVVQVEATCKWKPLNRQFVAIISQTNKSSTDQKTHFINGMVWYVTLFWKLFISVYYRLRKTWTIQQQFWGTKLKRNYTWGYANKRGRIPLLQITCPRCRTQTLLRHRHVQGPMTDFHGTVLVWNLAPCREAEQERG